MYQLYRYFICTLFILLLVQEFYMTIQFLYIPLNRHIKFIGGLIILA